MALLRSELIEKRLNGPDAFDFLVEEASDFTSDTVLKDNCGVGSMAYCLDDEKVYVKTDDGWGEA